MQSIALTTVSKKLSIPEKWLDKLITFESNWSPKAVNKISGAMGLIQFTNATAKSLGFNSALDLVTKYPDINSQLTGPVLQYLLKYAPFYTPQSLYMTVFFPAARNWSTLQRFPKYVIDSNPGIVTVQDYIKKVERSNLPVIIISIIAGFLIIYIMK